MKKVLFMLLISILAMAGCANRANTPAGDINDAQTEDTQKDTEDGSELEDETDENGDIDEDGTTQDEQEESQDENNSSNAGQTEESGEPDYEAMLSEIANLLPEGASLGEKLPYAGIMGGYQTGLQREGYVCENEYQDLLSYENFLVTPGAVCFANTDLEPVEFGDTLLPILVMRACEGSSNHEQVGETVVFEAKMLLFTNTTIGMNEIPEEDWFTYFWVICKANVEFDDVNEDCYYSTWIFLNQECFTKEEVMAIAQGLQ